MVDRFKERGNSGRRRYATRQSKCHRLFQNVPVRSVRLRKLVGRVAAGRRVLEQPRTSLSFPYINAAWEADCPTPAAKLVLIALADHADEKGSCWPALPRLAKRCQMTERGIRIQLRRLEQAKLIETTFRTGRPNTYRLALTPERRSPRTEQRSDQGNSVPHTPERRSSKPSVNPHSEPSLKEGARPLSGKRNLSGAERISLERERRDIGERLVVIRDNGDSESKTERIALRDRRNKIDSALHIPL